MTRLLLALLIAGTAFSQIGGCGKKSGSNGDGGTPTSVAGSTEEFRLLSPAADATGVALTPTFQWSARTGSTSYTVQVSAMSDFGVLLLNQTAVAATTFSMTIPLQSAKKYYWRVSTDVGGTSAFAAGSPAAFTTLAPATAPGAFTLTFPANESTAVTIRPTFVWAPSEGAATYFLEVTRSDWTTPILKINGITTNSWTPTATLPVLTWYAWRVTAINAAGQTMATNTPWYFATENLSFNYPGSFQTSAPANGATNVSVNPTFSWSASDGAGTYRFELAHDRIFADVIRTKRDLTGTSYSFTTPLEKNKVYYWRVFAQNPWGTTVSTGAPASFTTETGVPGIAPGAFTLSSPSNNATSVSIFPIFSWSASNGATSYQLEVSTDSNFLITVLNQEVTTTQHTTLFPGFQRNKTYYWRVTAKNAVNTTPSSSGVWKFTTQM